MTIHSFIPQILIEHLLCTSPVLGVEDTAVNKRQKSLPLQRQHPSKLQGVRSKVYGMVVGVQF